MKVVLALVLLVLTLALCRADECPGEIPRKLNCSKPIRQLVELDTQNGPVRPSAVKVKRCTSLLCPKSGQTCVSSNNRTIQVKVEGKGPKSSGDRICFTVPVTEHLECECSCSVTCRGPKKHVNEDTCSCECDKDEKRECKSRSNTMWSNEFCNCTCDMGSECSHGYERSPKDCECHPRSTETFSSTSETTDGDVTISL